MKENNVVLITTIEDLSMVISKAISLIPKEAVKVPDRKKLTRAQAAKFCGIGYHTFGKWTREGLFKENGFGRKKFFYEDELIQALNSKK